MSQRDYPSVKDYAAAQKEIGSCLPEFRATMIKSIQIGSGLGVPMGIYVAYRQHGLNLKPLLGKSVATWLTCTMAFTCMGLMGGVYNCLRVKM